MVKPIIVNDINYGERFGLVISKEWNSIYIFDSFQYWGKYISNFSNFK